MTPLSAIEQLLRVNKPAAAFILSGLGVIAAAAIVLVWLGGAENWQTVAFYIVGFAVLVSILLVVVGNNLMRAVLAWLVVTVFVLFFAGLVDSALQVSGRLPIPPCYLKLLTTPPATCMNHFTRTESVQPAATAPDVKSILGWINSVEDDARKVRMTETIACYAVANRQSMGSEQDAAVGIFLVDSRQYPQVDAQVRDCLNANGFANGGQSVAYSGGPVVIHYDADVKEDIILALSKRLSTLGWPVKGRPKFVKASPNTDQIRFYDAAGKEAATSLARLIASILRREIDLRDFSRSGLIAQDGLLEVWITK